MDAASQSPSESKIPGEGMSTAHPRRTLVRGISLLVFLASAALLIWGAGWQQPRQNPFDTQDFLSWLFYPEPSRAINAMPVMPGKSLRFSARDLCRTTSACGSLEKNPDGQFRFKDIDENLQNVITLRHSSGSGQLTALTETGKLFSLAAGSPATWRELPLSSPGNSQPDTQLAKPGMVCAAFSPSGDMLVAGYQDGTTKVWGTTGREFLSIAGKKDSGPITATAFSPDGRRIAVGFFSGLKVFELGGHELLSFSFNGGVNSVAFSPDGLKVLVTSNDGVVALGDLSTGDRIPVRLYSRSAFAKFSSDGSRIVTTLEDGEPEILDAVSLAASAKAVLSLKTRGSPINLASFSPDGSRVVTASQDGSLKVWNSASGKIELQFANRQRADTGLLAVNYTLDGSEIIVVSTGAVAHYRAKNGLLVSEDVFSALTSGSWAALSRDGSRVAFASASGEGRIRLLSRNQVTSDIAVSDTGAWWVIGVGGNVEFNPDGHGWLSVTVKDELTRLSAVDNDFAVVLGQNSIFTVRWNGTQTPPEQTLTFNVIHSSSPAKQQQQPVSIRSLSFVSKTEGWIVDDSGRIFYTNDGGGSWQKLFEKDGLRLTDIHVARSGVGWAVGWLPGGRVAVLAANKPSAAAGVDGGWQILSSYLAPWYFLLGIPSFLAASFLMLRAWRPEPPRPQESIEEVANSDTPLRWKDPEARVLKPLARGLSRFLRNVNTKPPLTLAITGRWGSGKSSLMSLLMSDLKQYGGRAVWFNAWHHHEEEHLLASLFEAIRREAPPSWWSWPGFAFRLRLFWRRSKSPLLNLAYFILFAAIVIVTMRMALPPFHLEELDGITKNLLGYVGDDVAKSWGATLAAILGGTTGVVALASLWLRGKLVALPANPAKLASALTRRASLGDFHDKLAFRHSFGEQFGDVCNALLTRTSPGLVILIDDLDRCQPDDVLKILEAVNYLVSAGPCTIVLGMDRRQIEYCVGLGFEKLVEGLPEEELIYASAETADKSGKQRAFARHYLEKLINIEVPVPTLDDATTDAMLSGAALPGASEEVDAPIWLANLKQRSMDLFQIARVGLVAFFVGMVLTAVVERVRDAHPALVSKLSETPAVKTSTSEQPSGGSPAGAATDKTSPPATGQFTPAHIDYVEGPIVTEVPSPRRWLWWAPTLLLIGLAILFGVAATLRYQKRIVRDSPAFTKALRAVKPAFVALSATPRAIKRYQNRMRYLAARLRPASYEPDAVDSSLNWLGKKLGRSLVPSGWFEDRRPQGISEPSLILLGALELVAPDSFSNTAELFTQLQNGTLADKLPDNLGAAWKTVCAEFASEYLSMPTAGEVARYATFVLNNLRTKPSHPADVIPLHGSRPA